jgi:hypothetical protein
MMLESPAQLSAILTILKTSIFRLLVPGNSQIAFWSFVHNRVARINQRFARLYQFWRDNALPASRAGRPGAPRLSSAPAFRLPQGRDWLLRQFPGALGVAPPAGYFAQFVARPDVVAFLTDVPQARRLLAPISRMLGVTLTLPAAPAQAAAPALCPQEPPAAAILAPETRAPIRGDHGRAQGLPEPDNPAA